MSSGRGKEIEREVAGHTVPSINVDELKGFKKHDVVQLMDRFKIEKRMALATFSTCYFLHNLKKLIMIVTFKSTKKLFYLCPTLAETW